MKDYKKILEGVVDIINATEKSDIGFANICTYIGDNCPELKESEDERIRKELIATFQNGITYNQISKARAKDYIAWLEKQGEQSICKIPSREIILAIWDLGNEWKELTNGSISTEHGTQLDYVQKHWLGEYKPADKVEPKFKIGDTIKCKYDDRQFTIKSVDLDKGKYTYTQEGCGNDIDYADEKFELVEQKPVTVPKFREGDIIKHKDTNEIFEVSKIEIFDTDEIYYHLTNGGYICENSDNFERVEQKPAEMKTPEESLGIDSDTYNKIVDECVYGEQKPAWSEEDESWFKELELMVLSFSNDDSYRKKFFDWLKSLKDRVQPQPKWSEEDEAMRTRCIGVLGKCYMGELPTKVEEELNWLKSLKPHSTWKPSDEQMIALQEAMNIVGILTITGSKINSLYQNLKKLK